MRARISDGGLMRTLARAAAFLAASLLIGQAFAEEKPEVGTSVAVKGKVDVEGESSQRRAIVNGATIRENEPIETSKTGTAEIALKDDSKLAIGPETRIVIEPTPVAESTGTGGGTVINLGYGSMRFVTAKSDQRRYKIKTPHAYIDARRAVFDIYVARNGEVAVLVHEGWVDVCPPSGCRRHDSLGKIVHVTTAGVLSAPVKWDGTFFKGVAIAAAFPFIGRSLRIDPIRRLRHADLIVRLPLDPTRRLKTPADVIIKTPRVPIPAPRLPF
ncbi:MAG: FecR domain-containing protein [Hyphomicrobiaceae bacterium]|nr:MAG: FecR domain-containing protein [Hyphomicrobiaceae bacterium]